MSGLLISFLVISAVIAQTQPAPLGTAAERQERLQYMKSKGAELAFFRAENAETPLTMVSEPVLRYSNPLGLGQAGEGITLLWLEGTRPMAAASFSIRPPRDDVYMECTSFSDRPLDCWRDKTSIWRPEKGGLVAQRLDDAPPPAAGKAPRLTQMREIARRFSATSYTQTGESMELRLLTTPPYRFAAEENGLLDGGLFALVVSNDPEQFMLLQAVNAVGQTSAHWQYTLARMCSRRLIVRLDDKEIWSVGDFYREPTENRKTGPYVSARLGNFVPAADKPPQEK